MSALGARAIQVAIGELGTREDPPGSNRGPKVDEYLRSVGVDPERGNYPWCAAFVGHCIRLASIGWTEPVRFIPSASCARMVKLNAALLIDEPEVGCVFVHLRDDGKGHTGFVTGLRDDGWTGVEGNTDASGSRTGGQVMAQKRSRDYATHFLRVG